MPLRSKTTFVTPAAFAVPESARRVVELHGRPRQAGLLDQRRRAGHQGVGLVGRAAPQADAGDGGTQVR